MESIWAVRFAESDMVMPTSQRKVEMLVSLTRAISRIHERIDASDSALQDVLQKFEKFKVLTEDTPLLSPSQVAPTGSFSDTGVPQLAANKERP